MTLNNILFEEKDNGVFLLTINRPKALNALNDEVMAELGQCIDSLSQNKNARALLITGSGDKAFVAGADITQFKGMTPEQAMQLSENGMQIYRNMENLPIPVIALVNGFCLGGGCELALACDMILASENAVFAQPEVKIGVMAGWGASQRLTRLVGRNRAMELLLTGRNVDAQEAHSMGIANHVYTQDELLNEGMKLAETIAGMPPLQIQLTKRVINNGRGLSMEQACLLETEAFATVFSTADKEEGVTAFLEKRKAEFKKTR